MKIVTDEKLTQGKLLQSLEQSNQNSKNNKMGKKAFSGMNNFQHSQTLDHKDKKNESIIPPSLKSVSPSI